MIHNTAYLLNGGPLMKRDCVSIVNALKNSCGKIEISSSTPIYSTYTGELIGHGSIPDGLVCDAPSNSSKFGRPYSLILCDDTGTYTAHAIT